MRPTKLLAIFCVMLLPSLVAFGQLSPVFLPLKSSSNTSDRPKQRIRPLDRKKMQVPQTVGTSRSDFPNINISQTLFADQNETSIAINPADGSNIVVGANDYRSQNTLWYFTSTDGGYTWQSGALPEDQALFYATDPSVGMGPDGIVYYANGRFGGGGDPYPINDVVCYRSSTKGQSWNAPVRVHFDSSDPASAQKLADKYYLAVAPTAPGPLAPKVYVTWAEYENGKSRIVAARSSDGGTTWSKPVPISAFGKFQAPVPTVAIGGEVYVVFIDLDTTKREILFVKSTDEGLTYSVPQKVSNYKNLGPLYPENDPDPHPIIKGHLRVNSFPSIAVDHSSKHFNRIYTTWAGMGSDGRHHIYLSKSDDSGISWSEAIPIEADKSAINTDKFFPWIAIDRTTGNVGICFYDSRLDAPANQMTDLFLSISEDGGESFSERRISDVSFNPSVTSSTDSILISGDTLAFFGDYNGLACHNGMWYPAWTDSRVGYDQDIYIGIVNPQQPEAVHNLKVEEDMQDHSPVLTWEHSGLTTFGKPLGSYDFVFKRSDGATIEPPSSMRSFKDGTAQPATSYIYVVTAVASGGSSTPQEVRFIPFAVRKPIPPEIKTSRAEADGFFVRFRIPDKNVVGDSIHGLKCLYYFVDGIAVDSFSLNDAMRNLVFERSFSALPGYHKFQMLATTQTDGEVVGSDTSEAVWLYAGTPFDAYTESFQSSKNIFSNYSWDTTSIDLISTFLNDSLPNVPYPQGVNTWFLLPSVKLSSTIHTLEFDHIALVAEGDSALVEVSFDNGVSYSVVRRYDRLSEPTQWGNTLKTSNPASDSIPFKWYIGQDAIIRFRLRGMNATNEDGWFVDNIRFTDKLSVSPGGTTFNSLQLFPSIVRANTEVTAHLFLSTDSHVSLHVRDILGRDITSVLANKYMPAGRYAIDFDGMAAGIYFVTATIEAAGQGISMLNGRIIVRP